MGRGGYGGEERIMLVRVRVLKRILCLVSVYAPQAGRAIVDK